MLIMKLCLYGSIYKNSHYLPEIESGYRLTSKVYELSIPWINFCIIINKNKFKQSKIFSSVISSPYLPLNDIKSVLICFYWENNYFLFKIVLFSSKFLSYLKITFDLWYKDIIRPKQNEGQILVHRFQKKHTV
jgi:hypothetical protein